MNIIEAGSRFHRPSPVLVLTDLQPEHEIPGRRYSVADAVEVASQCRRLLTAAREAQLPIAHFRRIEQTGFFNPETPLAGWIDDLRPWPGEMVFEHDRPSCYSVDAFARFIAYVRDPSIIIAGFGANYTILATAIDAFSRGHRVWFVRDATGSYGVGSGLTHAHACGMIAQFAVPLDTAQVIDLASGGSESPGQRHVGRA